MEFLYLAIGILGLVISSHYIVKGAKNIAHFFNISELFIGLTIISIGTSLPEIAVNVASGFSTLNGVDASGIAVGNVIGSALSLFTIILGTIVVFRVIPISQNNLKRDATALILSVLVVLLVCLDLKITRMEGGILILLYVVYLFSLRTDGKLFKKIFNGESKKSLTWDIVLVIGGLVLVVYSSKTVVESGMQIANIFNVEKSLIGILLIGLGTGLPELTISLAATLKKSYHLAIGNLLGSNVCDLLLSLGAGAVIAGFGVSEGLLRFDIPFLFFAFLLTIAFFVRKEKLERKEGIALILVYLIYLVAKLKLGV
ncbi:MAG: sodium:calcium antiporter [Parcubacteria group bacterium]|nr:sodium:calcium antiporter [Parcubacteria group bacterium]